MKKNIDILLITGGDPYKRSIAENTDKLLGILLNISKNIRLITFCDKKFISRLNSQEIDSLQYDKNKIKQFILEQLLILKTIYSIHKTYNVKIVLFAFGQDLQIIPTILSRIMAKKIIIRSDGRPTIVIKKYFENYSRIKLFFFKIIEEINYQIADIILTECKYMIYENNFDKYGALVGSLSIDINKFKNNIDISSRNYDIGFIGRFDQNKGIGNFLESLQKIKKWNNIIIIGNGERKGNVQNHIKSLKFGGKNIKYINWVENKKLPDYLNKIKLLVIPSNKEGLPNIIIEAMACGTMVLATPVGGIPGIIKDNETGFIMENNSPECIARNIDRVFNSSNNKNIVKNAQKLIEEEFTYEVVIDRYRKIIDYMLRC